MITAWHFVLRFQPCSVSVSSVAAPSGHLHWYLPLDPSTPLSLKFGDYSNLRTPVVCGISSLCSCDLRQI